MHFSMKNITLFNAKAKESLFSKILKVIIKITPKSSTKK